MPPTHAPRSRSLLPAWIEHSSLHVGAIAVAQVWGTSALLGVPADPALLVAAACGGCAIYQLDALSGQSPEDVINAPERAAWLRRHRGGLWVLIGAEALIGTLALRMLATPVWGVAGAIGLCGVAYVWPVLPAGRLKSSGALKPAVIAAGWTLGAVAVPLADSGESATAAAALVGLSRFGVVHTNAVLWDHLDRIGDAAAAVRSSATVWSARSVQAVLRWSLLGAGAAAFALVVVHERPMLAAIDGLGVALMASLGWRSPKLLRRGHGLGADMVVAWPAVTALVASVL